MFSFGTPSNKLFDNYKPLTRSCKPSRMPSADSSRRLYHPLADSAVSIKSDVSQSEKKPLRLREKPVLAATPIEPVEMITAEVFRTVFLGVIDDVKKIFRNFKKCKMAAFNCEVFGNDLLRAVFKAFFPVLLGTSVSVVEFATRKKTGDGWDTKLDVRYSKILCTFP